MARVTIAQLTDQVTQLAKEKEHAQRAAARDHAELQARIEAARVKLSAAERGVVLGRSALAEIAATGWPRSSKALIRRAEKGLADLDDLGSPSAAFDPVTVLDRFVHENDAMASVNWNGEDWAVMVNFGKEAADSNMVAGSLIGTHDRLREALVQALVSIQ